MFGRIVENTDTCIDLWRAADGLSEDSLTRQSLAPAAIPAAIRTELATLDANEISLRLRSPSGAEAWLLMLCGRSPAIAEEDTRDTVLRRLRGQRLEQLAASFLSDLRAAAKIEGL